MFSPPPTYAEMRRVCEQYAISPATYGLFEQQVYNIQRQSTRLNKWVVLTADLTLTELALQLNCSLPLLTNYLATYKEWQDPDLCDCGERDCTCGKYFLTMTHSRTALVEGTHIPDPFMDPASPSFADRKDQYVSPFPAVTLKPLDPPVLSPLQGVQTLQHPLAPLFPGTSIKQFARYLGAPIGKDQNAVLQFLLKRKTHATGIHGKLSQLNERIVPMGCCGMWRSPGHISFRPSCTHR